MKKLTEPLFIIGSSGDCADLIYATGFEPVDPVVFLQYKNNRFLIVPAMEAGRAAKNRKIRILTPADLDLPIKNRRRLSFQVIALMKKLKCRSVRTSPFCPFGVVDRIREAGIRVRSVDGLVFPSRQVKSPREIERIRQAQSAAVEGFRTAARLIASTKINSKGLLTIKGKPLTSEQVRKAIELRLLELDCEAQGIIVACGSQAADPHERGSGPLRAHQPIVLDIFPRHKISRYWGDLTRTVVRGHPTPELERMYRAVAKAQRAALDELKPGEAASTIHRAVVSCFEKLGYETRIRGTKAEGFTHSTGHGVGLDIHESPSISDNPQKMHAGNVVTVEPGLYYRNRGGIRIEDTVVVTKKGWEYLAPCEKRFRI